MAKFLVKRTQQELAITFFDRFKTAIADPNCKDLQTLFPATFAALNTIGDQIYYYDAYIQTLRESFEKDLRDLSSHLPSIIENHPDYFAKHPELQAILLSAFYIATALENEQSFGLILRDYSLTYLNGVNPSIKASVKTLRLISESLRDTAVFTQANAYWVSAQQIQALVNNPIAFKIYLGLLYQEATIDTIQFGNGVTLTGILAAVEPKFTVYVNGYTRYFTNLGSRMNTLTDLINKHSTIMNDSAKLEQYYQYISSGIDLLESASDVSDLGLGDSTISMDHVFFEHAQDSLAKYIGTVRSAANIVWDVKRRSYASAVMNAASIYQAVVLDNSTQTSTNLLKYGTFMATIVQADNSDEVEQAIEAMALPAGSSRIKRESPFNVSLNSYVGGFMGEEIIEGASNNGGINSFGATAVVGVSISEAHSFLFIPGDCLFFSTSVFMSLVDLGAITSYRATHDSTQSIPTIQLKDIFSPGVFLSFGLDQTPISLNFGYQVGPLLRSIQASQGSYTNAYHRWGFSICVDIPLLDFYTKPKN